MRELKTRNLLNAIFSSDEKYDEIYKDHSFSRRDIMTLILVARFARLALLLVGLCIAILVINIMFSPFMLLLGVVFT